MSDVQNAAEQIYINIGHNYVLDSLAAEQIYINVSVSNSPSSIACEQIYTNIGLLAPDPVIFGTSPIRARTGDLVNIVGTGFGKTPNTYSSIIQGQDSDGTWISIPTVSWDRVSASSDAYTDSRIINTSLTEVDPEHETVSIQVPSWSSPPNLPLRVVSKEGSEFTDWVHNTAETIYVNVTT